MSVRKVTLIKNRSYYYSTFNPIKIFGTEIAARQFEDQYYVDTMNYFTFFDKQGHEMVNGQVWRYSYETEVEWRMEDRKLIEIETHTPKFEWKVNNNWVEVGFFYIYDRAFYIKINTNPDQHEEYQKKIRAMNKAIKVLNKKWKVDIPKQKGTYKFSKLGKWESYSGALPLVQGG